MDYAVYLLRCSTSELYLDYLWGNQPQWPENFLRDDFGAALAAEFAALRETFTGSIKSKRRAAKGNFWPQPRILPVSIAAFDALARLSGPALVDRIGAGVEAGAFGFLAAEFRLKPAGLAAALGLDYETMRGRASLLNGDETERAFRAYRVLSRAREVLESEKNASKWMRTPLGALAGRTPLSLLARDVGEAEVLNVLGRIEHSVIL